MNFDKLEDFYQVYSSQRTYVAAKIKKKHIRTFDEQFWKPALLNSNHSILELGTGTGLFLAYLKIKGLVNFKGVDNDPKVLEYMPEDISRNVIIGDIWETLKTLQDGFDRIVMLDVLEHFSYFEGHKLLSICKDKLKENGKVVIRIPNLASPLGLQYQFGDLTHKSMYAPGNIRHLAIAAGYDIENIFGVRRGNWLKKKMESILFGFFNHVLTDPPPVWSANMIVILSPKNDK